MAIGKYTGKFKNIPRSAFGFAFYLKSFIYLIWIISIVVSIYGVYSEAGVVGTFDYLGEKIASPTFEINEQSLKIIEQGKVHTPTEDILTGVWNTIKTYWSLIFNLITIYVWISLLKLGVTWVFTGDTTKVTQNWMITITLFFLFQVIFIAYFHEVGVEGILMPYEAFKNLFKAMVIVFS